MFILGNVGAQWKGADTKGVIRSIKFIKALDASVVRNYGQLVLSDFQQADIAFLLKLSLIDIAQSAY